MPTVTTKIQPIDRDLVIRLLGTPQERSAMHAQFARDKLAEVDADDVAAIGHAVPHQTIVDGNYGASEDSVQPINGVIVYKFQRASEVLAYIDEQLALNAPVGGEGDPHPGLYRQTAIYALFADGDIVSDPKEPPQASEYIFINALPYAKKVEQGESPQAPEGVYEAVATMAAQKFSKVAMITFSYRTAIGGQMISGKLGNRAPERNPAIVVTLKG